MLDEYQGPERRNFERRNYCVFPRCGSALEIQSAHNELKNLLEELKSGQVKLMLVAEKQAGVLVKLEDIAKDVEQLQREMEEKVSKRDAVLIGGVILGVVTIVGALVVWHSVLK